MNLYLKVDRKHGEPLRKKLLLEGLLDSERKILSEGKFLLVPVLEAVDFPGSELVEFEGERIPKKPASLHEALDGKLSADELLLLPRAFDVIGDIAIIDIPEELEDVKETIGKALLETFSSVKVVAQKTGPVGSEFRTRAVEVVAGEDRKETVHREFGCAFRLDVETSYFSPRLGTERMRVASQVRIGERVLVLFAGVGPYAVVIAKHAKPSEVVAVELNPDAVRYMEENIRLNHVQVKPILGDARTVTPSLGVFDRVVMPLPKDAADFLDVALPATKVGGVVHFYDFSSGPEESTERVRNICEKLGFTIEILDAVVCGSYSPDTFRVCVDFKRL